MAALNLDRVVACNKASRVQLGPAAASWARTGPENEGRPASSFPHLALTLPAAPPVPVSPCAVVREICPKGMGGAERMPVYLPENWPEQLMKLQPGLQLTPASGAGGAGGAAAATAAGGAAGAAGAPALLPVSGTSSSDGSGGAVAGSSGAGSAPASRAAAGPGRIRVSAARSPATLAGGTHAPLAAAAVAAAAAAGTLGPPAGSSLGSLGFVGSPRAPLTQQQRLLGAAAAVPSLNIAALQLPAPVLPPVLTVRPIGSTSAAANAVPPGSAGTPLAALSPLSPFGALGGTALHPFGALQLDGGMSAGSTPAPTPVTGAMEGTALTPTTALAATLAATNFGLCKLPLAAQLPHIAAAAAMQQAAAAAAAAGGAAPLAAAGQGGDLSSAAVGVESPTAVAHGPSDPCAHPSSSASEAEAHHQPTTGSSGTTPEPQLPPAGQQGLPGGGAGLLTAA